MTGSGFKEGRGYTREDWDAVSDNPEWTEADVRAARPFAEVFPEMAAAIRKRGPARTKEAISIRIDADVLEKLRASGEGWQSRVNAVLRAYVEKGAA
ncbi:BrnA antitoxin family protein [Methylobacterium dankookense]|uniref:BrnA antitoxin family protein n=1 Tax=Methylobacterium dankookense TaxID=560405 RepID=A0A564G613_9HYPH|nr:BrnA antitoxin family protein [Methylobacterium dankookense]GJD56798.1 hypothetical protein IFDJLNFL_2695 [Methylobacterium dankookense]VUF15001.1 hypothetical protein MTDSW087_04729 [Methylobacterium dankookense]